MRPDRVTGTVAVGAAALALAALSGCGAGDGGGAGARPTVYAASSLRAALPDLLPKARYSFGGSDALRIQIERGAPADVLVAASPQDPDELSGEGRCEEPVPFATNELVLVTPAKETRVRSLGDLGRGGLRLAVGSAGVPVGVYTRALLRRAGASRVLQANRVSDEPNVASIAAKVRLGSADAGFVYRTDARLAKGALRVVPLPAAARPSVLYEACVVVRPGARSHAARAFLDALQSPRVQRALVAQGFGRKPASPRSE